MSTDFWSPLRLSIEIAFVAGIIAIIAGILMGKWMATHDFKGKLVLETVLLLPLVLPPTVVGFLLIVIFGKNSMLGNFIIWLFDQPIMFTWWAAVIASTIVAFPLMYQSAKTGFASVDRDIENAARVDGANEWQVFLYVSIPLALKALVSGGILSFTRALGEFGATLMFAGNIPGKTQTTPLAIYMAIDSGNMPLAWTWVLCMIAISFLLLLTIHILKV
ncbi:MULTISPECIES: molybdate ABC transporter permease subunit [Lysinibacillus]|uniref:molybdate ABC transporter permease subunit n=1 Tax=Lysinibacillus TaxID=400634 RepID=UPI001C8BD5D1|nr:MULTISPECIES: molybdate ABC transporter permease subunit [Lysinibacillus]MBX8943663.1 molybdate ABC transporter permease subunit [Lysinibacillus sp. K60]UUV27265.1 molybdate ABC transporter permease subunit [Lysinibacillus sp. FN11]UYB45533.1 molybdate ABC transporter permease subunit [Lysinibacillus capsici]WDU77741.1 molybdate ABC transporter permease subunit [Lysinibacillus sp. G01H]